MRYVTFLLLLGGILSAQTKDWSRPNLPQYFKQFEIPAVKPAPKVTLAPGQKCAIPLVNALKKDETRDPMIHHPAPAANPNAFIVAPPAPSCDDVK